MVFLKLDFGFISCGLLGIFTSTRNLEEKKQLLTISNVLIQHKQLLTTRLGCAKGGRMKMLQTGTGPSLKGL